jgi:hypothetical protein
VGAQCSKVGTGLLGYNFATEEWSCCHVKSGGNLPQTWAVRLTEEQSHGTVFGLERQHRVARRRRPSCRDSRRPLRFVHRDLRITMGE